MTVSNTVPDYRIKIRQAMPFSLAGTNLSIGHKQQGKVRDIYQVGDDTLILVATDRLTAFDRHLAFIPYKGQVLNQLSAWWFAQTAAVAPNHLLAVPDPNAALVKKCQIFPIEFVVRHYISGSTATALWTQYQQGVRQYCGVTLPAGLQKNQKLEQPILTPTTKEKGHDRPISLAEIIAEGWMTKEDWLTTSQLALKLFEYATRIAHHKGLILVDTKYEFGRDNHGNIMVVDEIHTPDSSRFWLAASYEERLAQGLEPENIDKEFLRLWFIQHADPYQDAILPEVPAELVETLSARYIQLYEMITGNQFKFPQLEPLEQRITSNITNYLR